MEIETDYNALWQHFPYALHKRVGYCEKCNQPEGRKGRMVCGDFPCGQSLVFVCEDCYLTDEWIQPIRQAVDHEAMLGVMRLLGGKKEA